MIILQFKKQALKACYILIQEILLKHDLYVILSHNESEMSGCPRHALGIITTNITPRVDNIITFCY